MGRLRNPGLSSRSVFTLRHQMIVYCFQSPLLASECKQSDVSPVFVVFRACFKDDIIMYSKALVKLLEHFNSWWHSKVFVAECWLILMIFAHYLLYRYKVEMETGFVEMWSCWKFYGWIEKRTKHWNGLIEEFFNCKTHLMYNNMIWINKCSGTPLPPDKTDNYCKTQRITAWFR